MHTSVMLGHRDTASEVRRSRSYVKFTVTGGNKSSVTARMADRGVAGAENKQCRKAELSLKL